MQQPQVEIQGDDTLSAAVARVEEAYDRLGMTLLAYDNLNSFLPVAPFCQFFQTQSSGDSGGPQREAVLVVMTGEWDERAVLTVLNVLLELRMDPDPPGQPPLFRFFSARRVPPVLVTLFGDSPLSEFECRAVLVAHFGRDLKSERALQLAAVGRHLVRECLETPLELSDAGSVRVLSDVVERLRQEELPADGAPLNTLICLGCLYGEILSRRFSHPCRWLSLESQGPWPVLVFGAAAPRAGSARQAVAPPRSAPQVVFNPIATSISCYKEGEQDLLEAAAEELAARLTSELEAPTRST